MSRDAAFLLGKGGVGKTTCALALALARSRSTRVLLLSLDPAHSIADLAGTPVGGVPRTIAPGLEAYEPDLEGLARARARRAVDLVRSGYRHLDALGLGGLADLVEHAPGLGEQSCLDVLGAQIERGDEERLLVVDMPATGQSVGVLVMPQLSIEWIGCLSALRSRILERRASIAHVRGPGSVQGPVSSSADPVTHRLGREAEELEGIRALLAERATHLIVINPEPLSIAEGSRLRSVLRRLGTDGSCLVLNRWEGDPQARLDGLEDLPRIVLPDLGSSARDRARLEELGVLIAKGLE